MLCHTHILILTYFAGSSEIIIVDGEATESVGPNDVAKNRGSVD